MNWENEGEGETFGGARRQGAKVEHHETFGTIWKGIFGTPTTLKWGRKKSISIFAPGDSLLIYCCDY